MAFFSSLNFEPCYEHNILGSIWFIPSVMYLITSSDFNGIMIIFISVLDWHDIWWYIGKLLISLFQNSHFPVSKDMFKVKLSFWYLYCKLWLHKKTTDGVPFFGKTASIQPAALLKKDCIAGFFQWHIPEKLFQRTRPHNCFCWVFIAVLSWLCLKMLLPAALKLFSKLISQMSTETFTSPKELN